MPVKFVRKTACTTEVHNLNYFFSIEMEEKKTIYEKDAEYLASR